LQQAIEIKRNNIVVKPKTVHLKITYYVESLTKPSKKCTLKYLAAMLSLPISQNRFTA